MRLMQKTAIVVVLAICLASTAFAAKRPDAPRPLEPGLRLVAAPQQATVAPLAIGNPNGLAMMDSWMTSDWEVDQWTTNYLWYDAEALEVVGGFFTPKAKNVTATVTVKDQVGNVVWSDSGVFIIEPNTINYVTATIGQLQPGVYKVIGKFKQGTTTVGQTYWIAVDHYVP